MITESFCFWSQHASRLGDLVETISGGRVADIHRAFGGSTNSYCCPRGFTEPLKTSSLVDPCLHSLPPNPPAHPRPRPFVQHEEGQPACRRGECETYRRYHVAGVEPRQRTGCREAEGLPGDGLGQGSQFRFHDLRRLPVLVATRVF